MRQKIEKWIDRDSLPKVKNRNWIDWEKCIGKEIRFYYDGIEDIVTIINILNDKQIEIDYRGEKYQISQNGLLKGCFGKVLKKINFDWKYNINDKIITLKSKGKIINRYKQQESTTEPYLVRYYSISCDCCNGISNIREDKVSSWSCGICSNQRVKLGYNDIWATDPNIATQLLNKEDGYKYTIGTSIELNWKCSICGNIINGIEPLRVKNSVHRLVPCPVCADGYSYPNKFMYNILQRLGINFYTEYNCNWKDLGKRRYDFYLPDYSAIIEMHGIQHYQFSHIQSNDLEKKQIALKNGIKHYIVIDCSYINCDFIKNNIIKSQLSKIFDLSNIVFEDIDYIARIHSFNTIINKCYELNFDETKVANELKIHRSTVYKYINDAINKGIIDKEMVKQMHKDNATKRYYQLKGIPYKCLETGFVYGSLTTIEAVHPNMSGSGICTAFHKGYKIYGYTWIQISRKEFNQIKRVNPEMAYGDYYLSEEDYHSPVLKAV